MFYFYPRSPCGERLCLYRFSLIALPISIHALLAESDKRAEIHANTQQEFLSTLSLRRATSVGSIINNVIDDFYPRSPCGERPLIFSVQLRKKEISIHALLAESDPSVLHSFQPLQISIHALLAESDQGQEFYKERPGQFLSTLSLRRATHPQRED